MRFWALIGILLLAVSAFATPPHLEEQTHGAIDVRIVSQPELPVIIEDVSATDAEELRMFHYNPGIQTVAAGTEQNEQLYVNPSTNTLDMEIDKLYLTVIDTDMIFRFYHDSVVVASGTRVYPHCTVHGSTKASSVEVYEDPTISARGDISYVFQISDETKIDDIGLRVILLPGETFLLTIQAGGTNKDWNADVYWVEK